MKQIHFTILSCAVLAAVVIVATDAQNEYENCSTNYTVLENALLETKDNTFLLSTTFFNPDVANPVYVKVKYSFSKSSNSTNYIWSAASLYLIVPPEPLFYLSLLFSDFVEDRTAELTVQLPEDCIELMTETNFTKYSFLYVLTQRLRLYAKYYRSLSHIVLPDGFEARVVPDEEKERETFMSNHGTKMFLSYVIVLPIIALFIAVCYIVCNRKGLNKSDHHASHAALICVGQTFVVYVAIMDAVALSVDGLADHLLGIICFIMVLEFVMFFFVLILIILFICWPSTNKNNSETEKNSDRQHIYSTMNQVKSRFFFVGLIPPLLCISSHIGFILEGWASFHTHGTAIMFFYLFTFVFLFMLHQRVLYPLAKYFKLKLSKCLQAKEEEEGLCFRILLIEVIVGLIPSCLPVYIFWGLHLLPVIRGTEGVVTRAYDLGHFSVIFVVFLLTYIVYKTGDISSGVISGGVIKFWNYLSADTNGVPKTSNTRDSEPKKTSADKSTQSSEVIRTPNIESDTDIANALMAIFFCSQIQGKGTRCNELLSEIKRVRESESGEKLSKSKQKVDKEMKPDDAATEKVEENVEEVERKSENGNKMPKSKQKVDKEMKPDDDVTEEGEKSVGEDTPLLDLEQGTTKAEVH